MIQFHEDSSDWYCCLAIEKQGAIFVFRGGCHNVAQYFAQQKDESIENRGVFFEGDVVWFGITKEIYASGSTSCFGNGKVGCVAVDGEDHATGMKTDGGNGVGSQVMQQMIDLVDGQWGGSGLFQSDVAEGN